MDVEVINIAEVNLPKVDRDGTSPKTEVLQVEEGDAVQEEEVSGEEEEWPSLGLELSEKDEEVVGELSVAGEEAGESEREEEWPTVKSIPGLESSKSRHSSKKTNSKQHFGSEVGDSFESSTLGELRFQDD